MQNNIPAKTLLKIFDLIQKKGVAEDKIFTVSRYFDPEGGDKILQTYIQKGVVGNLDLSGKLKVKRIPKGLKFKVLNLLRNKTLKHLPKIEAERILASYTNIQKIDEGLKCKELELDGNQKLKHLPKIQADEIDASYTNIQTIEEGLKCEELNLSGNKRIKHLPRIEAEKIKIWETNIQTIGDGLKCTELYLIGNKMLKEFPRNFEVENLDLRNTHFSETYTEEKIREKIKDGGGKVGKILI